MHGLRHAFHFDNWHVYRDNREAFLEAYEREPAAWNCNDSNDDSDDCWYEREEERQAVERARHEDLTTDWSQTKRGSHVDFASTESVPLKEGTQHRSILR